MGMGSQYLQSYYYGNGVDAFSSQTQVQIGTDTNWKEVHVGQGVVQALKTNNTRWGWGRNTNGQELGIATGTIGGMVTVITQLGADNDWKSLNVDIAGSAYGDGIKQNNALYHWGNNHLNVVSPLPTLFSPATCTLGLQDFDQLSLFAYPNPVADEVTLHLNNSIDDGAAEIILVNELGQKLGLQTVPIVNSECTINLSRYTYGVYVLSLKMNGQHYQTKIIKK